MAAVRQRFRRTSSYDVFDAASLIVTTRAAVAFEASGPPILRQDWPPQLHALRESLGGVTGWDTIGLGSPVGYPSSFIIAFVRAVVAEIAGSYVAVAAQTSNVPDRPLEPSSRPATAIAFRSLLPWLITANVARGESGTLRYDVRYNALRHAHPGGQELPIGISARRRRRASNA